MTTREIVGRHIIAFETVDGTIYGADQFAAARVVTVNDTGQPKPAGVLVRWSSGEEGFFPWHRIDYVKLGGER